MYEEDLHAVANAAKVKEAGFPTDIPMLVIFSNPLMRPYIDDDASVREEYEGSKCTELVDASASDADKIDDVGQYNASRKEYFSQFANVEMDEMSGPSRIYTYDPEGVAQRIIAYLSR